MLLLSVGADLPYLTGYEAMPLERLTMLVAAPRRRGHVGRSDGSKRPRVVEQPGVFAIRRWDETDDPVAIVAELAGRASTAAIGDTTWARFLLALQRDMPSTVVLAAQSKSPGPLRAQKDAVRDRRAATRGRGRRPSGGTALQAGEIALVGRTEAAVSAEISARLLAEGHHQVNFAIVARGRERGEPAPRRE